MLINPKKGMRVRYISEVHGHLGKVGSLAEVYPDQVYVLFDGALYIQGPFYWHRLQRLAETPEELDQQRREEHANKYL